MLIADATRRASYKSSSEQQLPNDCSPLWSYSCIDRPMTSWPCSASSAAATDESTPPDMATTILMFQKLMQPRLTAERAEVAEKIVFSACSAVSAVPAFAFQAVTVFRVS